jgi:hypothetical protein
MSAHCVALLGPVGGLLGVTTEGEYVTIDPSLPPAWQAIERLLDDVLPEHPSTRELLDDALCELVREAENLAVKEHGQQIFDVVFGEHFQLVRDHQETVAWNAKHLPAREDEWKI